MDNQQETKDYIFLSPAKAPFINKMELPHLRIFALIWIASLRVEYVSSKDRAVTEGNSP